MNKTIELPSGTLYLTEETISMLADVYAFILRYEPPAATPAVSAATASVESAPARPAARTRKSASRPRADPSA